MFPLSTSVHILVHQPDGSHHPFCLFAGGSWRSVCRTDIAVRSYLDNQDMSADRLVARSTESIGDPSALRARARRLEAEAQKLRALADLIEEIAGDAQPRPVTFEAHREPLLVAPRDPDGPRGRAAVLAVMREAPSRTWKVIELKRVLLRRGWAATPKAVEATIKRLRVEGAVISPAYGLYRLPPRSLSAVDGCAA